MQVKNVLGLYYVLDRKNLTITRHKNRTIAINNAIAKAFIW